MKEERKEEVKEEDKEGVKVDVAGKEETGVEMEQWSICTFRKYEGSWLLQGGEASQSSQPEVGHSRQSIL